MYSESHCHLGGVNPEDIRSAEESGFELLLTSGIDLISSELAIKTAEKYKIVRACIGIHPWYADEYSNDIACMFRELSKSLHVAAVSEIGLDYFGRRTKEGVREDRYISMEIQLSAFRGQISLAEELGLPVIVHDRTPGQEILDILEATEAHRRGAAIHSFNKDSTYVERCRRMGVYLSIGLRPLQSLTPALESAIKSIPMNLILTETDSDKPKGVLDVCDQVARIKGSSREEIGHMATENLRRLIKL